MTPLALLDVAVYCFFFERVSAHLVFHWIDHVKLKGKLWCNNSIARWPRCVWPTLEWRLDKKRQYFGPHRKPNYVHTRAPVSHLSKIVTHFLSYRDFRSFNTTRSTVRGLLVENQRLKEADSKFQINQK